MKWKRGVILLALGAAVFAGILVVESLADSDTSYQIACYVALADDVAPLIGSVDSVASSADCFAQLARVAKK